MNGPIIATAGFLAIVVILLGFAAVVLWKVLDGTINLDDLISEPADPNTPGSRAKASLSRFQFLIFTFVVAGLFLLLSIEAGDFVEIPGNVLGLLGISSGSYVVAKAVGNQKKDDGAAPSAAASAAASATAAADAAAAAQASAVQAKKEAGK